MSTGGELVHLYFCVDAIERTVEAVFSEYANLDDDTRYIKKAFHTLTSNETFWEPVAGTPDELISEAYEVYSLPVDSSLMNGEFGGFTALELFEEGNLQEEFLARAGHIVPHRP